MPSPRLRLYRALLAKERRDFLQSWAFWGMMLILCLLVGYSFIQAAALYAEASRSAPAGSDMARSLSPLDGVLVPTFGAYYLALTLLFPFVAIRALGAEKESGSIKLLLQMPINLASAIMVKILAMLSAWLLALIPGLSAIAIWIFLGGHIHWPETLNLLLGYSLYAFAVLGISLFAAALADSVSTAALLALALILGSWVLDFAGGIGSGWLARVAPVSLTASLKPFERGLFLTAGALRLAILGLGSTGMAAVLLPAKSLGRRLRDVSLIALVIVFVGLLAAWVRLSRDISEDRRNSFTPAVERALNEIEKPLKITVRLSPEDSRFQDLEHNILDKLRRSVPRLTLIVDAGQETVSSGTSGSRDYGWINYEYEGKMDRSTSNSEEEILPIIFQISGRTVAREAAQEYRGYPFEHGVGRSGIWFYLILPALLALGAIWSRRERSLEIPGGN